MDRRRISRVLFLLSIFLLFETIAHAEAKLEYNPEDFESLSIGKNNDLNYNFIVDKNSNNNRYENIQAAIDDAIVGSTIYIKKGYYSELITINKAINLVGEDKESTFIITQSAKNGYAIGISSTGVKISNLGICNKASGLYATGIKITASETTIDNCNIFDTPVGIAIWSSKNTISDCDFWGCEDEGIVFLGSYGLNCKNNLVTRCEFYNNCDGIEFQYSSNNTISNCEFYNNTHAGIDIISSSNNDNVISNCIIFNNEVFGIYISKSSGNIIKNCIFSNNIIMITSSQDNTIDNCELDHIYLQDTSLTLENCKKIEDSCIQLVNARYTSLNNEDENEISINERINNVEELNYKKLPSIFSFIKTIRSRIIAHLCL